VSSLRLQEGVEKFSTQVGTEAASIKLGNDFTLASYSFPANCYIALDFL
jgi:hypothetical protein